MVTESELLAAVDAAFLATGRGLRRWPDPHPDRSPRDDEYSRVTDAAKWRIVGARVDAWIEAVAGNGLATIERDVTVTWREPPGAVIVRIDVLRPRPDAALPLVVARTAIDGVTGAGVVLAVGAPAEEVALIPDCGCDACDSGSANELAYVDQEVARVIVHPFRRLRRGTQVITLHGDGGWSGSDLPHRFDVEALLADPTGWDELSGSSWLDPGPSPT